jgi:hypothetical protein
MLKLSFATAPTPNFRARQGRRYVIKTFCQFTVSHFLLRMHGEERSDPLLQGSPPNSVPTLALTGTGEIPLTGEMFGPRTLDRAARPL